MYSNKFLSLLLIIGFFVSNSALSREQSKVLISPEERIVFIGDSISDAYGISKEESYVQILNEQIKDDISNQLGVPIKWVNASVSGSLSSSAQERVEFALQKKCRLIILELGGNDALKSTPVAEIKKNLKNAIMLAQKQKVIVLVLGIQVFNNFGSDYQKNLQKMYLQLAQEHKIVLMPFVLEGVALNKELMQKDAKHPNIEGHKVIAKNVRPYIYKALKLIEPKI